MCTDSQKSRGPWKSRASSKGGKSGYSAEFSLRGILGAVKFAGIKLGAGGLAGEARVGRGVERG